MKKSGAVLLFVIVFFSSQNQCAQSSGQLPSHAGQLIDHPGWEGASGGGGDRCGPVLIAGRDGYSERLKKKKEKLDKVLRSRWEGMRRALEAGNVDEAVGFISRKNRENYREIFSRKSKEQLAQMSRDLADIAMIQMLGNHAAEYDIQFEKDGKRYSYPLFFEKNLWGVWEIVSF